MSDPESSAEREATTTAVGSIDPQVIDSIAVTIEDVVAALEANRSANRGAVLRITPPFAGRMRARLHIDGSEGTYDSEIQPIHLNPERLVEAVPAYPTADDTADLTDDDLQAHRRRHTDRVAEWRTTVRQRLCEETTVSHNGKTLELRVLHLG